MLGVSMDGIDARLIAVARKAGPPGRLEVVDGVPGGHAARESRVRVRAAILNTGVRLMLGPVSVDAAYVRARCDLAVALALAPAGDARVLAFGELALTGEVRIARGVLAALEAAHAAGVERAIVPDASRWTVAPWLERWPGLAVYAAATLPDALAALAGERKPLTPSPAGPVDPTNGADMADIRGAHNLAGARFAAEVAAAGGHSLLMIGPPGAGKTMIARRIAGILPALEDDPLAPPSAAPSAAFEVARVADAAGLEPRGVRPFRAPHHTASEAALFGAGDPLRPGEVTLAHRGVLFLDELPEFRRAAIERLARLDGSELGFYRGPGRRLTMPADALLVAAMNACPCGRLGDRTRECRCTGEQIERYRARVRPFAARAELCVTLPSYTPRVDATPGENSAVIRERVTAARAILAMIERAPVGLERVAQTIAALRGSREVTAEDRVNADVFGGA